MKTFKKIIGVGILGCGIVSAACSIAMLFSWHCGYRGADWISCGFLHARKSGGHDILFFRMLGQEGRGTLQMEIHWLFPTTPRRDTMRFRGNQVGFEHGHDDNPGLFSPPNSWHFPKLRESHFSTQLGVEPYGTTGARSIRTFRAAYGLLAAMFGVLPVMIAAAKFFRYLRRKILLGPARAFPVV